MRTTPGSTARPGLLDEYLALIDFGRAPQFIAAIRFLSFISAICTPNTRRTLLQRLEFTGEVQEKDRLLAAFARRYHAIISQV